MERSIRPLADLRASDVRFAGGKGANLGELIAAGLPVPEGFVIGTCGCDALMGGAPGARASVEQQLAGAVAALGEDVPVAVRSSGISEDGAAASYAGINETVHNVRGTSDIGDAVRRCCSAHDASHVEQYARARGGATADDGFAVVVQRQIRSCRAGVAFSADPVSGDVRRIIIEAARGHGEAVVSGAVTPDRLIVDKETSNLVSSVQGKQQVVLEATPGAVGLVERELGETEVGSVLTEGEIRELTRLVLAIEAHYGSPQDIEWAFDTDGRPWILQTRSITTLPDPSDAGEATAFYDSERPAESRWTRANVGEAVPGVPTPLTWSLWKTAMETAHWSAQIELGVAREAERGSAPVVTLARGWPAISVDLVESQLSRLPGFDPDAFAQQFFGGGHARSGTPPLAKRAFTAVRVAARAPVTVARQRRRLATAALASAEAWSRATAQPAAEPHAQLEAAAARFSVTLTAHTLQAYICQGLYQAVERVAPGRAATLVSGDGDLSEARLAEDLWLLGAGRLTEQAFLSRHGFHGPAEGELAAQSWREDPEPIRRSAARLAAESSHNPADGTRARSAQRRAAEAEVLAAAPRWRRPLVGGLIGMARRAVVAREVGKTAILQDLDVARHAARALEQDAVWCTLQELISERPSAAALQARRRERGRLAADEPPLHFVGDPAHDLDDAAATNSTSVVTGIGASPGRVRGRARVITDPSTLDGAIGGDEILVARTTDPSWVAAFLSAGGLVIDVGGALSHAAIIARELGVPCVIGTGNGTTMIPEGALIDLDGSTGTVRVLAEASSAEDPW